MTADYNKIFRDAMLHHGYAPYRADMLLDEWRDKIAVAAVTNSDHESYRVLADAVEKVMGQVADPNRWDGDDSEEYILCRFLEWLPDLIAHQVCDKIRSQAVGGQYAADWADPFVATAGEWLRKSDGAPVPGLPEVG
jgi:hypothetical protein